MNRPTRIMGYLPRLAALVVLATSAMAYETANAASYTYADYVGGKGKLAYTTTAGSATLKGSITNITLRFYDSSSNQLTSISGVTLKINDTTTTPAKAGPPASQDFTSPSTLTFTKGLDTFKVTSTFQINGTATSTATLQEDGHSPITFSSNFPSSSPMMGLLSGFSIKLDTSNVLTKSGDFLIPFKASTTSGNFQINGAVPEPATFVLMGLGLTGIPVFQLIRRKKATTVTA